MTSDQNNAFTKVQQTIIRSQGETDEAYALIREVFAEIESARSRMQLVAIITKTQQQYS